MQASIIYSFMGSLRPIVAVLVLSFLVVGISVWWLYRQKMGSAPMNLISERIAQGSAAFLKAEYKWIAIVTLLVMGLLGWKHQGGYASVGTFLIGALCSCWAGVIGMWVATRSNVRTAEGARKGLLPAFRVSFVGGAIMGIMVVALALGGLVLLLLLAWYFVLHRATSNPHVAGNTLQIAVELLTGFALGGEMIALFARVAGGIYTKAADVGADIVGKNEVGIPEDDPRNPAVIADNVGDNVGDVAGMGADLFGSYVSTLLAAMVLGAEIQGVGYRAVLLPLMIGALGLFVSLLVIVGLRYSRLSWGVERTLEIGNVMAMVLTGLALYGLMPHVLGGHQVSLVMRGNFFAWQKLYACVVIGLLVGWVVSWITGYFTGMGKAPVNFIVRQSVSGAATNLIGGLGVGMVSTALPMVIFAIAIGGTFALGGFYGVALSGVGLMATTAIQLAMDAFGPIADNAGGIAEMSGLPAKVRERTDVLDAVGNTTAAMGKGFAIASAALTSLALFASFVHLSGISGIDLYKAPVLAGLFVGAMMPFLFSAFIITAVGKAAMDMVEEVRRQFKEIKGLLEGKAEPQYGRCVEIATYAALRQMLIPGLLALVVPFVMHRLGGAEVLGAFLGGLMVSATAMALFQCNAGGAWDNAKKSIEKGFQLEGEKLQKGSSAHQAAVIGDTVGDPLKDASGPAMNILIKLAMLVALMIA